MISKYVNSGNVKLHLVVSEEQSSKETILFLHGYPENHLSWSKQWSYFKDKYRIAAFDIRGAGDSSTPYYNKEYGMDYLLEDVNNIINSLVDKNQKIHIVGHDWGAVIFWCYVSIPENASRIKTFTAISCPHPYLYLTNILGKLFSFNPTKIMEGYRQFIKSLYVLFFQIPALPEFIWGAAPEFLWQNLLKASGLGDNQDYLILSKEEILKMVLNPINLYREILKNLPPKLPVNKIEIPIALIIPENDLVITPEIYEGSESIAKKLNAFYLKANHFVHREKPIEVNSIIEKFISNQK